MAKRILDFASCTKSNGVPQNISPSLPRASRTRVLTHFVPIRLVTSSSSYPKSLPLAMKSDLSNSRRNQLDAVTKERHPNQRPRNYMPRHKRRGAIIGPKIYTTGRFIQQPALILAKLMTRAGTAIRGTYQFLRTEAWFPDLSRLVGRVDLFQNKVRTLMQETSAACT